MTQNYNFTLLEYMRAYKSDDNKYYQAAAFHQMVFVRDDLSNHLLNTPVFVVGHHYSKSVELPVYAMRLLNGIMVVMRENFHGWVVSIMSPNKIHIPDDLVHGDHGNGDIPLLYCEGFLPEWVYKYKTEDFTETTVRVNDDFRLYTLLYLLDKENLPNANKIDKTALSGLNNRSIETVINQYVERHSLIKNFNELFTSTYKKMTDYDFCQENNLGVFTYDLDDICNRIIKYPEIGEMFLKEKLSFDWGEYFGRDMLNI